ncbi:MAG: MBL fold metallo-hydrolase [Sediminibacterium sp.]|nr:MBL fold metallo-hydrolase [Sediminibacterium sp.]
MSLFIASLNSGSNGNCYYIGNQTEAVLIDAGLSCREIEIRMKQRSLETKKLKAIFVSHEHTDHIKGVSTLAQKYQLPVYITPETAKNGPRLIRHLSQPFTAHQPIQVGGITVTPFGKEHDAADPHSFVVSHAGINIGVITDIGTVCDQVTHYFKQCHAAFLESNYDEVMLANGKYSQLLKNRISGGKGHISNTQALELFIAHKPPFMTHLLLSHLSRENNTPELAKAAFEPFAGKTLVTVASRYEASEVFQISHPQPVEIVLPRIPVRAIQTSLF